MTTETPAGPPALPIMRNPAQMPGVYLSAFTAAAGGVCCREEYARLWYGLGVGASHAGDWARFRFPPAQAWGWIDLGFTPVAAATFREQGVSPEDLGYRR